MSIGISEDHRDLAATVRAWADSLGGPALVRAAEQDVAADFAGVARGLEEMGLAAIAVPEASGGAGGTLLDAAVALEACAQGLVPGDLLGATVAAMLTGDATTRWALELDGVTWDVCGAQRVLRVGEEAAETAEVLERLPQAGLDLSRRWGAVRTGEAAPLTGVTARDARRLLTTLAAAEAAGVARWCLATAVAYAGVREQFGRRIGSFQAVKHLCAQMLETAEAVTAAAWDAASAADGVRAGTLATTQWDFALDVARAVAFEGAAAVAKDCIQVLGGIGFTWEHDAHLYLRRALALRALAGGAGADAAASRLTAAAVAGVRREVAVDLAGADAPIRAGIAAVADKIAAEPEESRRAALVEHGYLTPHWPAPYGLGADAVTQLVVDQELARAGVTRPDIVIAGWALPTILEHGTDAQRERFVLPSLRGELVWCQLFSEPGAGSDLASLRTRAERVEGGWSLTGQKVWTSVADRADWGICLARTDADVPQHQGISYFLVDMRSPGIDVRPLREITGEALFNEVFLDGVFVPDDCLVAQPGDGWRLARTTLANERVAMATSRLATSTERAVALVAAGARSEADRVAVGHSVALSTVCSLLGVRATLRSLTGQGPGAESSVAKLLGVRNRQEAAELVVRLHGAAAVLGGEEVRRDVWEMLNTRCLSIAGGTTQVLRNVAGERILGLPR